jgi:hypothetical protein
MKVTYVVLVIILVGCVQFVRAQSGYIGVLPMQYIPSFAGSTGNARLVTLAGYRNVPSKYYPTNPDNVREKTTITSFSFDHFIPKIASGIGLTFNYLNFNRPQFSVDTIGSMNRLSRVRDSDTLQKYQNAFQTSLVLSPKISLKGKYTIAPALQITHTYLNRSANLYHESYRFQDSNNTKDSKLAITGSVLFNAKKYYIGLAVHSPGYYFSEFDNYRWGEYLQANPFWFTLIQAGYTYQRKEDSKFSFTPQIVLYSSFARNTIIRFMQLTVKLRYKNIIGGVGNGIFVGYQNERISVVLGQRFGVRSHTEISFRFCFKNNKKI